MPKLLLIQQSPSHGGDGTVGGLQSPGLIAIGSSLIEEDERGESVPYLGG